MSNLADYWSKPASEQKQALKEVKETLPLEVQAEEARKRGNNPCVVLFGPGPEGQKCKTCAHLDRDYYHNKTYLKCDNRNLTRGPGSDHKAHWSACAKYER